MGASAKSTSQAAVLLALLGLAAVALRGSLPGSDRTVNRPHPLSNTAALVLVIALLAVSLSIIAVATVSRIRNPPASASAAPVHVDSARGGAGRPGWRFWLIAAVGVAGALVLIHLLAQWDFSHPWSPAQSGPGQHGAPSGAAPIDAAPTAPPPSGTPTPADVTTLRVLSAAAVVFVALVAVGTLMTARRSRPPVSPAGAGGVAAPAHCRATPPRSRWRGPPNSGWPRSVTSAANRARRSSRATRRWSTNSPCSRRRSAGIRHPVGGAGPRRRPPRAARRQRDPTRRAVRGGAVQPARDDRGAPRDRGATRCGWCSPNLRSMRMKKLVAAGVCRRGAG